MPPSAAAGPRNYETHPARVSLALDLDDAELIAVLYRAVRQTQESEHGKPADQWTPTEVRDQINAQIRARGYDVIAAGRKLMTTDQIASPTLAARCQKTATELVYAVYGEPSTDPRAHGRNPR